MDAQMPPNMAQMAGPQDVPHGTPAEEPAELEGEGDSGFLAEAKRAIDGIKTALYKDKKVSDQFLKVIDPKKKTDSMTRAVILLVTELDKKLDLDSEVLPAMTAMAAGELMELAEAGHGITFSEIEQKQIVMAAFEGVLQAYGADQQDAANFVGEVGPDGEQQALAEYQAAMPSSEGVAA